MNIAGITAFNAGLKKDRNNLQQKNINFEGHKLVNVFNDPNYKNLKIFVYELTNGQKVIVVPKKGPDSTIVKTVVKTGGMNEPDELRGISHFTEHLVFDGSKKGSFDKGLKPHDFDKIMEEKGFDTNAHTCLDRTAYFFSASGVKPEELSEALKAHATMIKYPSLPPAQYKKEREVVIQEIKQGKDDPTGKQIDLMIKKLLGMKSKSSDMVAGTESNIANMTRNDVFEYHKRNYSPDNMETIIVGNVNPKKIVSLVDKYFDTPDFRPSKYSRIFEKINPVQKTQMSFLSDSRMESSSLLIGFKGPEISNPKDAVASKALLYIMGLDKSSRFNKKLIPLDTESFVDLDITGNHPSNPMLLNFGVEVQPGDEQKVLNYLKKTILELKKAPITKEELDTAKINLLNDFSKQCENSEGISNMLEGFVIAGGPKAYEKYVEHVKSLTPEDMAIVAEKYLDIQKASVSILQPKNAQNKNISFKGGASLISSKHLKKYILPNNINLIINDNPNLSRASIGFKIESETLPKAGVPHILSRVLEGSTAKHSQEALAFERAKLGLSDLGIDSTYRGIIAEADSLTESLPDALKVIREMLFEPKIDKVNFEKAKRELMLELQSDLTDAKDRALETMYPDYPAGISDRILKQHISKIELSDVQKYYDSLLDNSKIKVAISGPLSQIDGLKDLLVKELAEIKGKISPEKLSSFLPKPMQEKKVVVQLMPGKTQSDIMQLFHVKPDSIKDVAAMNLLSGVLSGGLTSRLFMDLREKQKLAYHVSARLENKGAFAQQQFIIQTGIKDENGNLTGNIEKSLRGFEKHQKRLMKELVSESELNMAKKMLVSDLLGSFSTAGSQNDALIVGLSSPQGVSYYNKLINALKNTTAEDVRNAARKYFSQPSVISVVTTPKAAKQSETFLKSLGEFKIFKDSNE